ncbi:hypothetical protein LOCC1_G008823 [Lachnellula occidentalis]|uniref:BTB domain-containing protein n=1 Tax=Lachnellula occidentalis TaxID=215460 RepID=A0A8H8RCT4_9HELO|nr:hypothetical protein LOCC1_G008823 [Lachnellula occidentalis]
MNVSNSAIFDANDLGTDIVTIHVGPKEKAFAIHKDLICNRSDFFSKAFNGPFKEGVDGKMHLPEDDPQAFSAVVAWMYRDQLPLFPTEQFKDDIVGCDMYINLLLPLFQLAEKLCINTLANQVMDRFQDVHFKHSCIFDPTQLENIYAHCHGGSKLRTYGVLMVIRRGSGGHDDPDGDDEGNENEADNDDDEVFLGGLLELQESQPDFGRDFITLQMKYGYRFQMKYGCTDAQIRDSETGFGQCFFHTHAKSEVCHLGPEPIDTNGT